MNIALKISVTVRIMSVIYVPIGIHVLPVMTREIFPAFLSAVNQSVLLGGEEEDYTPSHRTIFVYSNSQPNPYLCTVYNYFLVMSCTVYPAYSINI